MQSRVVQEGVLEFVPLFGIKLLNSTFIALQMKVFGLNYMHGLNSAILAIFQKSADGLNWPCSVSSALNRTPVQDFNSFPMMFY